MPSLRVFKQEGDYEDGNFANGDNWVGNVAPANGDSFIVEGTEEAPITVNIDDGLDQDDKVFVNGTFGKYYKGKVGLSTTTPFMAGFSGSLCFMPTAPGVGGSTEHFIGSGAQTIANLLMLGGANGFAKLYALGTITKAIHARGTLVPWSGTWGELHVNAKPGTVFPSVDIMNADIAELFSYIAAGTISPDTTTGRIRKLHNVAGSWNIHAGTLNAANILGGNVAYNSLTAIDGAIIVHGGDFALTNAQAQTVARLDVYPAGKARINLGVLPDTITAFNKYGGEVSDGAFE